MKEKIRFLSQDMVIHGFIATKFTLSSQKLPNRLDPLHKKRKGNPTFWS